jgi:hypothetical protein
MFAKLFFQLIRGHDHESNMLRNRHADPFGYLLTRPAPDGTLAVQNIAQMPPADSEKLGDQAPLDSIIVFSLSHLALAFKLQFDIYELYKRTLHEPQAKFEKFTKKIEFIYFEIFDMQ